MFVPIAPSRMRTRCSRAFRKGEVIGCIVGQSCVCRSVVESSTFRTSRDRIAAQSAIPITPVLLTALSIPSLNSQFLPHSPDNFSGECNLPRDFACLFGGLHIHQNLFQTTESGRLCQDCSQCSSTFRGGRNAIGHSDGPVPCLGLDQDLRDLPEALSVPGDREARFSSSSAFSFSPISTQARRNILLTAASIHPLKSQLRDSCTVFSMSTSAASRSPAWLRERIGVAMLCA